MWSHGTKDTLLDGEQCGMTMTRKDLSFLIDIIFLFLQFFLPLCIVYHPSRCYFVPCDSSV